MYTYDNTIDPPVDLLLRASALSGSNINKDDNLTCNQPAFSFNWNQLRNKPRKQKISDSEFIIRFCTCRL